MLALLIIACIGALIAYCLWKKDQKGRSEPLKNGKGLASSEVFNGQAKGGPGLAATRPAGQETARKRSVPRDRKRQQAVRALENHRLPAEILAQPLAEGYARMVDELRRRYPLIPFSFPPMKAQVSEFAAIEDYLSRSGLVPDYHTLTPRAMLHGLLSTVRDSALDSYFAHRPDFSAHPVIPKEVGSALFWLNEGTHSLTDPGSAVPPDWQDRKEVVYYRDMCGCRCCGREITADEFHVHHVKGRSRTGNHQLDNLVTLCSSCHSLMPGHTVDLINTRPRPRKRGQMSVTRVKKREIEDWTQDLLNEIVQSLADKYNLPAPKKE